MAAVLCLSPMAAYSLGLDFGTGSVRAVLLDLSTGREVAEAEWGYRSGEDGVVLDPADPDLARQHPLDYLQGMREVVPAVVRNAGDGFDPHGIVGIGVDTTGSTPIPVDRRGRALSEDPRWSDHPAAMAWLWKDHTAQAAAEEITAAARAGGYPYLLRCGGSYSSEWFWSKILHCLRTAPEVFAAADSFVELCDFVPAWLTGNRDPRRMPRSVCAAGHKAMFAVEWGGLPAASFLAELAPELGALRERLYERAETADRRAGTLAVDVAAELGLPPGIPVAVGALDAHLGAVGAGIAEGELVKVIGTSTCDMAVAAMGGALPDVEGLCGVVPGSILPDCVGFEAGQSAVGDIFGWCARLHNGDHEELNRAAARHRPGTTGLLALDWHNGNRSVLVDPALSGAVLGLNLQTTVDELYRAMIEATAFGARVIVDRLVAASVSVRSVVGCGGIAHRSPLLMQIYADVLDRPVAVSPSAQTCALGAAITGAVAGGHFATVRDAQLRLCPPRTRSYDPEPRAASVYGELYRLYRQLHDAFGVAGHRSELAPVMKQLLAIRRRERAG